MKQWGSDAADAGNDIDSGMIILVFVVGTKMIADVETFRGANLTAIVKAVGQAKTVISSLCQRHSLMCQKRKVNPSHSFISVCDEHFPERIASVL